MKYFKIKKKGKTKGWLSKKEKIIEAVCDCWYKNHKKQLDKVLKDSLLYGTGMTLIKFRKSFKS